MIKIERSNQFKKDYKLMIKRGNFESNFFDLLDMLITNITQGLPPQKLLPSRYNLHKLYGNYKDCFECHIKPDWLLIFTFDTKVLRLERTGTHSDLF